jgi:nucleoside-diphosphate-sugar epimerase
VLRDLIALVEELSGGTVPIEQHDPMPGDSQRNGGAIDRARELLGWEPRVSLRDGITAQLDYQGRRR